MESAYVLPVFFFPERLCPRLGQAVGSLWLSTSAVLGEKKDRVLCIRQGGECFEKPQPTKITSPNGEGGILTSAQT